MGRKLKALSVGEAKEAVHVIEQSLGQIIEMIEVKSRQRSATTLVAIDGCGGSGKSTLATALARSLENADVVNCDYVGANPSLTEWRHRLVRQVIEPLLDGRRARYSRYEWRSGKHLGCVEVEPGGVVIVEGVSTLHSDLYAYWDVTIWIECPRELRLARGVDRDGEEMRSTWVDKWMPEEDSYVASEQPQMNADLIFHSSEVELTTTQPKRPE